MAQIVHVSSKLSESILTGFLDGTEASIILLHLPWFDTANSLVYVLLESCSNVSETY